MRKACGTFLPFHLLLSMMPGPVRAMRTPRDFVGKHWGNMELHRRLHLVYKMLVLSRFPRMSRSSTTPSSLFDFLLPTVLLLPQCLHRATTGLAPAGPNSSRPSSHVRRYASSCWDMTKVSSVVSLPISTSLMPWATLALP